MDSIDFQDQLNELCKRGKAISGLAGSSTGGDNEMHRDVHNLAFEFFRQIQELNERHSKSAT